MKKPPQPLKGIELQKQLLNKAVKPTTNPLQQAKNQTRFNTLNKLNTVATTPGYTGTASPGYTGIQPGVSAPQTPVGTTTPVVTTPTTTAGTTPYYYGASGTGKGKTVKDPTTGKTYSADSVRGQELATQYGYTDAPVEPGTEDVATYAEIGAANTQAEWDATVQAELDLTGEAKGYTSLEEYLNAQSDQLEEDTALQKEQYDLQKTQIGEQASAARNAQENQVTAASALIGSQEGVTSTSNLSAYDTAKNAASVQISRLQRDQDMSIKAIEQAKVDLARAERAGNTELAEKYRSTLLAAESAAQQTETDYVNALTMASEEERNVQAQQNANLTTFTDLVGNGTELTPDAINNYAETLGLDFKTAYDYYTGAQAIRDDKNLSVEEKEIANATNQKALDDALAGIQTAQAQNIDYLNKQTQVWSSQGLSEAEISQNRSELRQMLGIENEDDPGYQAEIAYKLAQTAYSESNTAVNYQDLLTKQLDYAESMGYTGEAYIPNSTRDNKYKVTTSTSEDGSTSVQIADANGKPLAVGDYGGQCGTFVNDLFGQGVFGDDYAADKLSKVDFGITVPAPGMAIVLPTKGSSAVNGHVVYITGVDSVNQQVNYMDSNGDGKSEKVGIGSMTFQELGQLITSKTGGLVVNNNASVQGGSGESDPYTYGSYYNQAINELGLPEEEAAKWAADITTQIATGQFKNEAQSKDFKAYTNMIPEGAYYAEATKDMSDSELESYADNAGYLNEKIVNLDGEAELTASLINQYVTDPVARQLVYAEQRWLAGKLRGDSGAAISVAEYLSTGSQFWPRKGDDATTIKAKQKARENNEKSYYSTMGPVGQAIYGKDQAAIEAGNAEATAAQEAAKADQDEYDALEVQNDPDYQEWISSQVRSLGSGLGSTSPLK